MKNFLSFVAMDWSGSALPVRTPSLSLARADRDSFLIEQIVPQGGRYWSRTACAQWIIDYVRDGGPRTLVGIDANLGLPADCVTDHFPSIITDNIRSLWRAVDAFCAGDYNFYGAAMAAHPTLGPLIWSTGTQPPHFPPARRHTEIICAERGFGYPESPFKWIGPRQVGKGGFAAMRLAAYLDRILGERIAFWPFDPPSRLDRADLVMGEIYPRLYLRRHGKKIQKIRNDSELQTVLAAEHVTIRPQTDSPLTDHDTDALVAVAALRSLCGSGTDVPSHWSDPCAMGDDAKKLEGWIFGL